MIHTLLFVALVGYGVRYALSGADNALFYAKGTGRDVGVEIHNVEAGQQWASHASHFALFAALYLEAGYSLFSLAAWGLTMFGVSLFADYYFNAYITRATGGVDTSSWFWPLLGVRVPKLFHGERRVWQRWVGLSIATAGATWLSVYV